MEKGSTLLRVAKTHLRFGHFEYFYFTQQHESLKTLADYTIAQYFPHLEQAEHKYNLFFREVLEKTAKMVAQWQAAGFAHGVMNTDNMSILGETLDFGPYGFMDNFDWHFICNHSDVHGRYAFSQQPDISYWNCGCLARTLQPLTNEPGALQQYLDEYPRMYSENYLKCMGEKLGLTTLEDEDPGLITGLLKLLQHSSCDYTQFFRQLSGCQPGSDNPRIRSLFTVPGDFDQWATQYNQRLGRNLLNDESRQRKMKQVNPKFVLRNYLAQQAIERAEQGDYSEIESLMAVLEKPYDEHLQWEKYAEPPPEWAKKLEVSCSS